MEVKRASTVKISVERFTRTVHAGTVIFRQGETGHEMFVLQSGKVRLSRAVGGVDVDVAECGPGDFFGEMSILNDRPRAATAVAIEDAVLLVLDPPTFEAMIKANTEIAVRLLKKLAQRLEEANAHIERLTSPTP